MLFMKDGLVEQNDAKALFWLFLSEDDQQAHQVIQIVRKRGEDAAVRAAQKYRTNGTRNSVSGKILKFGNVRYG